MPIGWRCATTRPETAEAVQHTVLVVSMQDEVVSSLMSQLPAVDVEDLPGLVKYIIGAAGSSNTEQVCAGCGQQSAVDCCKHTACSTLCLNQALHMRVSITRRLNVNRIVGCVLWCKFRHASCVDVSCAGTDQPALSVALH